MKLILFLLLTTPVLASESYVGFLRKVGSEWRLKPYDEAMPAPKEKLCVAEELVAHQDLYVKLDTGALQAGCRQILKVEVMVFDPLKGSFNSLRKKK